MSNAFSRRDFLKASAAAVLALSVSGALTGCGEQDKIPTAVIKLGEFEVTVSADMMLTGNEVVGGDENSTSYLCKPNVTVQYNGNAFAGAMFKDTFSAKIGDAELKLNNKGNWIARATFSRVETYVPEFGASTASYNAFKKGTPFKLYVTLQERTAEFTLTSAGKITVAAVEKK